MTTYLSTAPAPKANSTVTKTLKVSVVPSNPLPRPTSGQMYPRTK